MIQFLALIRINFIEKGSKKEEDINKIIPATNTCLMRLNLNVRLCILEAKKM